MPWEVDESDALAETQRLITKRAHVAEYDALSCDSTIGVIPVVPLHKLHGARTERRSKVGTLSFK